ncbi:hypothetical protein FBR02_00230 [Anaerolineae bacterium CFX9]|nr:hypothetical protein [Anaerolineae bacterium CFX9]
MRRIVIFIFPILLLSGAPLHAQSVSVPNGDIDRTFGVVEAYYRPDDAVELGATWDRMIFYWYDFQPSHPLQWRTGHMDPAIFEAAAAGNRTIAGIVKGTPEWASHERLPGGVPFGLHLPIDDPRNFWAAYLRRLVAEYQPLGVRDWIIWNEPDIRPGEGGVPEFLGDVEDFYHIVRVAYLAIKSVDPDAHVNLPGMLWWGDRNFRREPYLGRLLRYIYNDPQAAANNYYFDGIGIHQFFNTGNVWNVFMHNIQILRSYGLGNKEIWFDEYNASPRRDPEARIRAPLQANLQQQADYIVQASATALAAGATRIAVYRLYDNHFVPGLSEPWGLIRGDGTRRPAFYAYQQVIQRFPGARAIQRYHIPEGTLITFLFEDRTLYVMWSNTFRGGEFLINANRLEGEFIVTNAQAEETAVSVVVEGGAPILRIPAPGAERIDLPSVVIAGEVRLVELPGGPRTVFYRTELGAVTQIR